MAKSKRKKGRPGPANHKDKQAEAEDKHIKTDTPNIEKITVQGKSRVLPVLCCSFIVCLPVYLELSVLASILGIDLQSMLSLQWHAALLAEQWVARISPKLASPHLSMAFFMFQDAAFLCALAWSVFIILLFYG